MTDNLPAVFEPAELTFRGLRARRVLQKLNERTGEKQCAWVLRNAEGAVSFVVMICKKPPQFEYIPPSMGLVDDYNLYMPVDVGVHWAIEPRNPEDYTRMDNCFALDGADCWYDGSGLWAIELLGMIMQHVSEQTIWAHLYSTYMYTFHPEAIEE